MHIPDYRYPIEQCSVPEVRRPQLKSYRDFRRECLERLQGDAETSVRNQILDLTWHTAVFRTLNEARRLEPRRSVNGAMWELTTAGYANLITLGIRRLVDTNPKADSAWNVLERIARRPELLTRELFVAHDGLPYDYEKVLEAHLKTRTVGVQYLSTVGPDAFDTSQRMHEDFDAVCGRPSKRKRLDRIDTGIFDVLRAQLKHPVIEKVCTMVDKTVAHAERIDPKGPAVPIATFNDVDEALGRIVRVCQFISWNLLAEGGFSSVMATPQFNVLEHLDQPWCLKATLPALHEYWNALSRTMDEWGNAAEEELLAKTATTAAGGGTATS
jgi:hypothetical protein